MEELLLAMKVCVSIGFMLSGALVMVFFMGASMGHEIEADRWDQLQNTMKSRYNFKFYGDCDTPKLALQTIGAPRHSTNGLISVIRNGILFDVFDVSLSDGDDLNSPRKHGFILRLPQSVIDFSQLNDAVLTTNSDEGDCAFVSSKDNKYSYITVLDKRYYPVVSESVCWHSEDEMQDIMSQNLDIVYEYLDKFCSAYMDVA